MEITAMLLHKRTGQLLPEGELEKEITTQRLNYTCMVHTHTMEFRLLRWYLLGMLKHVRNRMFEQSH